MILRYLRIRDWLMVFCCAALLVSMVYFDLRIPEYMSEITYGLQSGAATSVIFGCGTRMLMCAGISVLLGISAALLAARVTSSLCRTLRKRQFSRIGSWSRQDLDSFSVASLITRSTNDVYQIQQFFARAIMQVIKAPVLAIGAIVKIAGSEFQWTAVTVAAMLILLVLMVMILCRGIPYIRKMQWFVDSVNGETRDQLEGTRTIRAYNAESYQSAQFERASEDLLDNAVRAVRIMSPLHPIASSMMNFLTMAIYLVGAGVIGASIGSADVQMRLFSDMIVFTSYATQVLSAIMMATGILRQMPAFLVSCRRIEEVISHESGIRDGPMTAEESTDGGRVTFDHVSFTYPGTDLEVLHDVSFSIRGGGTLAIVGPTASGKSTIVSLIVRMYDPTLGTVEVGGLDVRGYGRSELTRMMSYVPQNALIFSGSLRDNVAYGDVERSDDDVMRALRIAQLSDLPERLPEGLDTDISQHGWNLSGGQKQRLSVARAVCKGSPIYLFDDTFSALDYRTDLELRRAISRELGGSTKIVVAQRVGTIMDADHILVLDEGRVVGSGTHSELMGSCALYREIAQSQLEDFDGRS